MTRKRNPNGTRIERENKLAAALGLGSGRSMVMAMLSAYESGQRVAIEFSSPNAPIPVYYCTPPIRDASASAEAE